MAATNIHERIHSCCEVTKEFTNILIYFADSLKKRNNTLLLSLFMRNWHRQYFVWILCWRWRCKISCSSGCKVSWRCSSATLPNVIFRSIHTLTPVFVKKLTLWAGSGLVSISNGALPVAGAVLRIRLTDIARPVTFPYKAIERSTGPILNNDLLAKLFVLNNM